ncbi:MAG: glucose 1-dehydrogenase [Bacteroidales bacterium]
MDLHDLFDLKGKIAIVTGGGDGIGKGCCEILAQAGAFVAVSDLNLLKAQNVANGIIEKGGRAIAIECNVLKDEDLVRLVDTTVKEFGTINILVNNAGGGGGGKEDPFKTDRAYFERIFNLNVFSAWRLCQLTAPYMAKSQYGSIINITSMASINNSPAMSAYAASKAALNHMAENLAYDFGGMNIRINNVGPGATETNALQTILTPEIKQRMLAHTPIKRLGKVSDIAGAVLYFASPVSEWVSGQILFVNGGGIQTLD